MAVDFLTPACEKQRDLERSDDRIYIAKVQKFRHRLNRVAERLPSAIEPYKERAAAGEHLLSNKAGAAVYVVQCVDYVKIGFTSRYIKGRLDDIVHANPFPLVLVGVAPGSHRLENKFHRRFASYRHRREWFRLDKAATEELRQAILDADGVLRDVPVDELCRTWHAGYHRFVNARE